MKSLIFVVSLFIGMSASASELLPAFSFKAVECVLKKDDVVVQDFTQTLMILQIENDFGRFAQVRLKDGETDLQYQVLIEDDVKAKGAVLVLQNLMVSALESSTEFSAKDPSWLRIRQGAYGIECALKKAVKVEESKAEVRPEALPEVNP